MVQIAPITTESNLIKRNFQQQKLEIEATPDFGKVERKKRKYSDPLMQWPLRGLAFTNDIGAAIMDIAPTAGQALWIPALMYFGADIYDKYRNNKAEYDPSAKRGVKQAIFQALASVIFPIAVVHTGQKTASMLNKFSKEGVSLQLKEDVIRHQLHHMSQLKLRDYADNPQVYKDGYTKALDTLIDEAARKKMFKNPISGFFKFVFGGRHPEKMTDKTKENLHKLINARIDDIFEMRKDLLEGKKPEKMSEKMYAKFNEMKEVFKNDAKYSDDYLNHATKDILKKMEENKIFKTKLHKTLGGFVALGLLIKPMDSFVETVIMHKYVEPGLNMLSRGRHEDVDNFKKKTISA